MEKERERERWDRERERSVEGVEDGQMKRERWREREIRRERWGNGDEPKKKIKPERWKRTCVVLPCCHGDTAGPAPAAA